MPFSKIYAVNFKVRKGNIVFRPTVNAFLKGIKNYFIFKFGVIFLNTEFDRCQKVNTYKMIIF